MKGIGLGLLPETIRFFTSIVIIVLFQFIYGLDSAITIFIVSVFILLLNFKIQSWKIFSFIIFTTFLWLLLGNWLFSPDSCKNNSIYFSNFSIFTINDCGFRLGLEMALKRTSMIIVGWAWFGATGYESAATMFTKLSGFVIGKENSLRYVSTGFALASRLKQELYIAKINAEILFPRVFWLGFSEPFQRKFMVWKTILQSLIRRLFEWIPELTFCGERAIGSNNAKGKNGLFKVEIDSVYVDDKLQKKVLENVSLSFEFGIVSYISIDDDTSWLIKVISGEIPHIFGYMQGCISYGDEIIYSHDEKKIHPIRNRSKFIFYVQSSPYNNFSTVSVSLELEIRSDDTQKISEIVERLKLSSLLERNPFTLSGGEAMRVALASALVSDSPIILLDAPFSELDQQGRNEIRKILTEVEASKSKTIIVFNYQNEQSSPIIKDKLINNRNKFPLLELKNCAFKYGDNQVLQNTNIILYKNNCIVITGNNGSGKTTLLKSMAGQLRGLKGNRTCSCIVGLIAQEIGVQIIEDQAINQIGYAPINN